MCEKNTHCVDDLWQQVVKFVHVSNLFSSTYATERQAAVTRDAGTGVHDGGTTPLTYKRGGGTGALT